MLNVTVNQSAEDVVTRFHQLYYTLGHHHGGTWKQTYWMGVETMKFPQDLWIYQELIYRLRPELIVETGTYSGGSALYMSHICDVLGLGEIVTIDIERRDGRPEHPRITYMEGSSTDAGIVAEVRRRAAGKGVVMVILDSDHRCQHVVEEMRLYHPLVTLGSYLIVEDTNINGHPVQANFGPGPMEAVEAFMRENREFEIDRACEKLLLTANKNGYLRRRG